MIRSDNIDIRLEYFFSDFEYNTRLKEYTTWLKDRNIKYNLVMKPLWSNRPTDINLRNEDAVAFKLRFEL